MDGNNDDGDLDRYQPTSLGYHLTQMQQTPNHRGTAPYGSHLTSPVSNPGTAHETISSFYEHVNKVPPDTIGINTRVSPLQ